MPKDTYIPCLLRLFRQYGYDGATLTKISEATGLGKASLYHHFPGGKDEMVTTVLDYLEQVFQQQIVRSLQSSGEPRSRLQHMGDRLLEVYAGGEQPCLWTILLLGSARDVFHDRVQQIYHQWIAAIAQVLQEAGLDPSLATQRAEEAIILVQGGLVLAQGLNNPAPFQRIIQILPETLCRPVITSGE